MAAKAVVYVKCKHPQGIRFPVIVRDEKNQIAEAVRMITIPGSGELVKKMQRENNVLIPLPKGYGETVEVDKEDWDYILKNYSHIKHLKNGIIVYGDKKEVAEDMGKEMIDVAKTGVEPYDLKKSKAKPLTND